MSKDHILRRKQREKKRSHSKNDVVDRHFFRSRVFFRFLFYIALLVFVFSVIYCLFFAPFLKVDEYDVYGFGRVPQERILSLLETALSGTNQFGVSNANLLLISTAALEQKISASIAEVHSTEIKKVFPSKLRVELKEYDTIMIVCGRVLTDDSGDVPTNQTREACVSVDEDGFRGQEESLSSEKLQANPSLIIHVDDLLPSSVGGTVFTPEMRSRLFYLIEEMPYRLSLRVVGSPRITSLGSTHVEIMTDEGWVLFVDMAHEPRVSLRVLEAFFEQTRELDIRSLVEEIDIRLLDKIFYKKKEQEVPKQDIVELNEEIDPQREVQEKNVEQ